MEGLPSVVEVLMEGLLFRGVKGGVRGAADVLESM